MSGDMTLKTPTVPRLVGEVRPDDDRVRVVGTIKTVLGPSDFTLEDPTGTIEVSVAETLESQQIELIREGMVVRVHGAVEVSMDGGQKIHADLVQDFSRIDMDLYCKVHEKVSFS
ncbi:MAG TPA: OB-fold nucleic acid binding domain-containing protein [Candidatus Lokiarchaeia archaeon]|nr:OB-fold nucleic acid binding domain-containing protein [Candidatus Lokiarchaeia archaeon]